MKKKYEIPCNIAQTLNIIGDRWTLLIVHEIFLGKKSYKELEEKLTGIATNLLSSRLKELEENGIIKAEVYQERPLRYCYSITDKGKDLREVFNAIILWGHEHLEVCFKKIVDKNTGDEVELRYYNPKTKKILDYKDVEIKEV
ncbi:helix-turn-helix domain-containing protein [uncultured Fusobacterium sp.]|jgi:DNA-binding HxlR family transcriptional regulator|uniref:winged helix-turn-helix transcriptional regulator n=1 Tax=uncultured Fusobacterium sp. TaxID=159267 RepID=UPI00258B9EE5|nr:helix-turn-helix domain-containing protein [uncultured Fusobacterium sp.]